MNTFRFKKNWRSYATIAGLLITSYLFVSKYWLSTEAPNKNIQAAKHEDVRNLEATRKLNFDRSPISGVVENKRETITKKARLSYKFRAKRALKRKRKARKPSRAVVFAGKRNRRRERPLHSFKYERVLREYTPRIDWSYFNNRKKILNNHSISFNILPTWVGNEHPYLIIMVLSQTRYHRTTIRQTYGSVAHGQNWPGSNLTLNIKMIFVFGDTGSKAHEAILKEESKIYGDILQGNFSDSYKNLTLKVLTGLKYVAEYFPDTQYVLKADDDTFTDVDRLVRLLSKLQPVNTVLGFIHKFSVVKRRGQWGLSRTVYPFPLYPQYAAGNTYVLTMDYVKCVLKKAKFFPYMLIEDAFITGIMCVLCNGTQYHVEGFTHWKERVASPKSFLDGKRISGNRVKDEIKHEIWDQLLDLYG
ncbi:beta-1,3-galactosyltransferase 1-like [Haliotis rufescens]|uniref:beta-1,3-galactosyltransferase 1-like n=1 Tax=Haliotis rufescens TaxID=6454 RepID=UPI00201F7308|nr:beta-1,3-galactosyltransferase 1-like [Haliotis rufescens]